MIKGNVPPESGGCWYCLLEDEELEFSWEFDTFIHRDCVVERLKDNPQDDEARIFAEEFGIV